jgi:PAS domain S-box-containing protein
MDSRDLPMQGLDEDMALRSILHGTASRTGELFFVALVKNLASALNTDFAWVTEYFEESRRLRALAFLNGDDLVEDFEYDISGTPCEPVIAGAQLIHHPSGVQACYPQDADLRTLGLESYMGVPLLDLDGTILGHMAVMDRRPMPEEPRGLAVFRIFAARAAAELQRMRVESNVRESEEKLARLVDSAMDAIIELDHELGIILMNTAAERVFGLTTEQAVGTSLVRFLSNQSWTKLHDLMGELHLDGQGKSYLWIPGGLDALNADKQAFSAEATFSCFELARTRHYTLILRSIEDRLKAEARSRSLEEEAEYLREELKAAYKSDEIIGESPALAGVLQDVAQVAPSDMTVLVMGETGTGKELITRAIHAASERSEKPLIKVNCGALPTSLIESELFGHEPGAFTGATKKREGRFKLADGATLFLDEVGELPMESQVKLLRVLQEGEFEPVGSSCTERVDVRVVAATNKDLFEATQEGSFREDLYYRLAVFPIQIPPLRDRVEDVPLLAQSFVEKYSTQTGMPCKPLTSVQIERLCNYNWPGNLRELQNVIERAIITARDGYLDLNRALPESSIEEFVNPGVESNPTILTEEQLQMLERKNLIRALETTGWQVGGEKGAALLLGMKASTLNSRLKALGIKRPDSN